MKELTREEKDWLLGYCMEPENIEIALAIGYLQTELREQILLLFAQKLDENVKTKLKKQKLSWMGPVYSKPLEDLGKNEYMMCEIKKEDFRIQLVCSFEGFGEEDEKYDLWVGAPSEGGNKDCLDKDLLVSRFGTKGEELKSDENQPDWKWWFYPNGYKGLGLEDLSTLHRDNKKIEDISSKLVLSAKIISEELEK